MSRRSREQPPATDEAVLRQIMLPATGVAALLRQVGRRVVLALRGWWWHRRRGG